MVNATANDAVFQVASRQRGARVRAAIVEREHVVADAEQTHGAATDDNHPPLPGAKFVEEADPLEFVHVGSAFSFKANLRVGQLDGLVGERELASIVIDVHR